MPRRYVFGDDTWRLEAIARQRNFVFPDTVINGGEFYRNLVRPRAKLNVVQRAGAAVLGSFLLSTLLFSTFLGLSERDVADAGFSVIPVLGVLSPYWLVGLLVLRIAVIGKRSEQKPSAARKRK